MAQLVVTPAGVPSKTWPGGIISLRASDWIGDSAGASVETDSRAIEGDVVRETQQYSGHIDNTTGRNAGMTAMNDTLTIDLSLLNFTAKEQGSEDLLPMAYGMYLSLLIEGDWGTQITNYDHNPLRFDRACSLGVFGEGFYDAANDHATLSAYLRNCPQYRMFQLFDYLYFDDPDDVLHVRAFSRDITSIEFLIDQVIFLPLAGGWGYDYTTVTGGENTSNTTDVPVDGDDGGDDNGKFTWHPRNSPLEKTGGWEDGTNDGYGGGDYQQDDSEYMLEIVPADGYTSDDGWNGGPNPSQHAYSIAGAYHREAEVYVEDDFSRTTAAGSGWGSADGPASGGGYRYSTNLPSLSSSFDVDGSRGHVHMSGTFPRDDGGGAWYLPGSFAPGVFSSDFILSGKFEVAQASGLSIWDGLTTVVSNTIGMTSRLGITDPSFVIQFDIMNAQWMVAAFDGVTFTPISGWFDVSSWFTVSDSGTLGDNEVGFKIELRRFLLRAKVWEASGGEPGTWDTEDFHPLYDNRVPISPAWVDYPYTGEDALFPAEWQQAQLTRNTPQEMTPFASFGGKGYVAQWDLYFDDIKCEFDPDGDTANVNVSIETPKGTEVGRIEVPSGAWHFVYWGKRQYATVIDDTGALDFAQKVWSDAGAAELQRAELPITYFFAGLGGGIVSMNWRSADRQSSGERVLSG